MNFPADLKYTKDHEWIRVDGDVAYVGITDYAQGELGEIVFVDITTEGEVVAKEEVFGTIEAVKTVSDLFMPVSGEVIERMGELGMIIDVSHASDGTFRDIMAIAKGTVIASHSNCREIAKHPRNLTDEMIWQLADAGGIAGLNLYGPFLGREKESRIEDMTAHILHMLNKGGSDFPAIGTDFDGFGEMEVMEIGHPDEMEKLWEILKQKGVKESQLDKIWYRNAMRVLKSI